MEIHPTEQTTAENRHSSPHNHVTISLIFRSSRYMKIEADRRQSQLKSELHEAALTNNWGVAKELLENNPDLIKTPITKANEIALHIAALEGHEYFVSKLLEKMEISDLEHVNVKGCTALCFAATAGHTRIAKMMVETNPNLPTVNGADKTGPLPLYMATLQGHGETAMFLYDVSHIETWNKQEKFKLLRSAIISGLYDLSIKIVEEDKSLAVVPTNEDEWTPFQLLARNKLPPICSNGQGLWFKMRSSGSIDDGNRRPRGDPYELLDCLWNAAESIYNEEDVEPARTIDASDFIFIAAKSGNSDFVMKVLKRDHDLLYKLDHEGHSIFHVAVLHRHEKIFEMYDLRGTKNLMATSIDDDGNNMLHLAAKLAPRKHLETIPNVAMQMHQEVLWFKEVEKLVQPSYRTMENNERKTPLELFQAEHRVLIEEAENFMKKIAKSCMLVTILIATVVFTTAFTVPGGYDNDTGYPILRRRRMYTVFLVSEAVATICSLISMLMFLSILTSRYSDDDFLDSLPFWLIVGLSTLFLSIVAMMVAFCTCLLFFEQGRLLVMMLFVFFGSVPAMFVVLKYPLLVTVLAGIYSSNSLFRSKSVRRAK